MGVYLSRDPSLFPSSSNISFGSIKRGKRRENRRKTLGVNERESGNESGQTTRNCWGSGGEEGLRNGFGNERIKKPT